VALGSSYERTGDREAALAAYREALRLDADHAEARARSAALAPGT